MSSNNAEKDAAIAPWKLERFLLGELPETEMEWIAQRIKDDCNLAEKIRILKLSDQEFASKYPAVAISRQIDSRTNVAPHRDSIGRRHSDFSWIKTAFIPVCACLVIATMAFFKMENRTTPAGEETRTASNLRIKGPSTKLYLIKKTGPNSYLQLQSGDTVKSHDLIQPGYFIDSARYGTILSIDGNNTITTHLPPEGDRSVLLDAQRRQILNFSLELDDAAGYECFYLITAKTEFSIPPLRDSILESLKNAKKPTALKGLSENFSQDVIILNKGMLPQ